MLRPGEFLVLLGLALAALSCSSDGISGGGGSGGNPGRRGEVLGGLGQSVVMPLITELQLRAAALETALAESSATPGGRDGARAAWHQTMETWQQLEVMQFGPLGASRDVMGGQDLKARIYSWPLPNRCAVDRQTVGESYDDPDALEQIPGVPTGLWAIEYLLFTDDPNNGCTVLDAINQDGAWQAMADMIPERRLTYAASLSTLVRRRASDLVDAWKADGDNFIEEMTNPGRSGAVYGTAQEGLNAVSDAMFYLEKETKELKLGVPLGNFDPESLESQWALRSKEHVIANLLGFQTLFLGGDGDDLGFDDLLRDMGADDVADDMASAIAAAIAATQAVPGTFRNALTQDPDTMTTARDAIDAVTLILDTELVSFLDLELPDRAAGDND